MQRDLEAPDADAFHGLELPAPVIREALGAAGLEPIQTARLLGLPDRWEPVIRFILGLAEPRFETRTHVTRDHAVAFADAIAQVDPVAAARLTAAIEQAEVVWRADAARQLHARTSAGRAANRRSRPRATQGRQLEPRISVEVLARLVERTDAAPEAIGHITGRRARDVRVMLGLTPDSERRFRRTVRAQSARSIAAALVVLARTPYEKRILARELTIAQATTGMSLLEEIPTGRA